MLFRPEVKGRTRVSKTLVVLSLAAVASLSTGCFDTDSRSAGNPASDISSIARPFSFGRHPGVAAPKVAVVSAEDLPLLVDRRLNGSMDAMEAQPLAQLEFGRSTSSRDYQFARVSGYWNIAADAASQSLTIKSSGQGLSISAALYLDKPFSALMANLFKPNGDAASALSRAAGSSKDEAPNPFTDAKQKADAAAAATPPKPATAASPDPAAKSADPPKPADSSNGPAPPVAAGAAAAPSARFMFLGDFDGTGVLKAVDADRVSDATFSFADGSRVFSLHINPGAAENQRSFGIEDLDGDGVLDLLVTARAAIFGGVLRGAGDGSFTLADTFLTGYEPIVATAGPARNGNREILSVNLRTGTTTVFRAADRYKRILSQTIINFTPDYISHLVETQTGSDFVLVSQDHKAPKVYRWRDDNSLDASKASLATEPSIMLSRDFIGDGVMAGVEAYQIGSYASVLLANGHGQSFNVANMRVTSQVFLAIGDLSGHGTLDVAVAYLLER
jgi:hypothetical protein